MKERYGARSPRSWMMRFHSQTAGVTLTAQQPMNNVVRVAYQALAAVLGGTQSLHTNSLDETLALPTEDAVRLALRTQQIIAHETGVAQVIDPLGGSYYLESLTILPWPPLPSTRSGIRCSAATARTASLCSFERDGPATRRRRERGP